MVVDTSALIAILEREDDAEAIVDALESATLLIISAGTLLECTIVALARRGEAGVELLRDLVAAAGIETVPVSADLARIAHEGYARYGKGRHPARLNFGDCFAYALAKNTGEPLLFKGDDFAQTDIVSALGGLEARRERLERYATWTDDDLDEFEDALDAQRQIDPEMWK